MILYLTHNDSPSGVYWGQVTDVVRFLNSIDGPPVRLVALVSGRTYRSSRRQIRDHCRDAWVIPQAPSISRWWANAATLAGVCAWTRPSGIICRGPFAADLALGMRRRRLTKRVCFDGRGAYAAETEEFLAPGNEPWMQTVKRLEHDAIHSSDFRLAVSRALVEYWRSHYDYAGEAQVIIPCTVSVPTDQSMASSTVQSAPAVALRGPRLVFSGGAAGWQSLGSLQPLLLNLLETQPNLSVLFLSRPDSGIAALAQRYPGRVDSRWVTVDKVHGELSGCDVGVMVRDDAVTNRVASPVKFAEYLSAGLRILISDHLGDYSDLVRRHELGWVCTPGQSLPRITTVDSKERDRLRAFAASHLTKEAHRASYQRVVDCLS
ncbi:MAG: hypothetical protein DWH79_00070 [Planctomycetota bacterium]|nr:MAG: hypothetical protein DWH79_00070 [Planctomycetota bacterium]